jgi:hypothetical protein
LERAPHRVLSDVGVPEGGRVLVGVPRAIRVAVLCQEDPEVERRQGACLAA